MTIQLKTDQRAAPRQILKRRRQFIKRPDRIKGSGPTVSRKTALLCGLHTELEAICGSAQADQILQTIRKADRGQSEQNCLAITALGETLQFVRRELRAALTLIRAKQKNA